MLNNTSRLFKFRFFMYREYSLQWCSALGSMGASLCAIDVIAQVLVREYHIIFVGSSGYFRYIWLKSKVIVHISNQGWQSAVPQSCMKYNFSLDQSHQHINLVKGLNVADTTGIDYRTELWQFTILIVTLIHVHSPSVQSNSAAS